MRILVVDDDPIASAIIGAVLEDAGHRVIAAENGIEAAEAIEANTDIDLIVSDMNMPLVTGIDLLRDLRDQGVTIPFILLTGDDPEPLMRDEPRLDGCLTKDESLETSLVEVVAAVAARRSSP